MQRILVYTLVALLSLIGVGMMLSFTAGGLTFGLGYLSASLALWLLYRGLLAQELTADLMAQSLLQRTKATRDLTETTSNENVTVHRSEPGREEPRPSQLAAGD